MSFRHARGDKLDSAHVCVLLCVCKEVMLVSAVQANAQKLHTVTPTLNSLKTTDCVSAELVLLWSSVIVVFQLLN